MVIRHEVRTSATSVDGSIQLWMQIYCSPNFLLDLDNINEVSHNRKEFPFLPSFLAVNFMAFLTGIQVNAKSLKICISLLIHEALSQCHYGAVFFYKLSPARVIFHLTLSVRWFYRVSLVINKVFKIFSDRFDDSLMPKHSFHIIIFPSMWTAQLRCCCLLSTSHLHQRPTLINRELWWFNEKEWEKVCFNLSCEIFFHSAPKSWQQKN